METVTLKMPAEVWARLHLHLRETGGPIIREDLARVVVMDRATPEERQMAGDTAVAYSAGEDLEIDEDACVSRTDDGFWVQGWVEAVDGESEEGDAAAAFRDLLTDLMHLARENGWDFGALAAQAADVFGEDVAEENR